MSDGSTVQIVLAAVGVVNTLIVGGLWFSLGSISSSTRGAWRELASIGDRIRYLEQAAMNGRDK